jgi:transposase
MGRPMREMEFSESERVALHHERFHHEHPRVRQKMEIVYLKSQGLPHSEIARLTRVCENTVRKALEEYREGGVEKLKEIRFYRPQSELNDHSEVLEAHFREHPPMTLAQAAAQIEELTGLRRSRPQVRVFLKARGMELRKVGMVPAKADPVEQERFKKTSLNLG